MIAMMLSFAFSYSQVVCTTTIPTFTFTYTKPVTNGQIIGCMKVCDQDVGQTETWSITVGNSLGYFTIVKSDTNTDGLIKVVNAAAINASTTTSYTLTIRVTDNGVPPLYSSTTVIMNEGNSPPVVNNQTFSSNENVSNGTLIGTVLASDPNAGQALTYSIVSGNSSGAFSINTSTGVIMVANNAFLNYEAITSFPLVVRVTDNASSPLTAQATVTVNIINVNETPAIIAQGL